MNKQLQDYCKELEQDIQNAYESGPDLNEAERLAAKFLGAQIKLADEIRNADLDARMKKSGLKAVKAAVYLDIVQKADKKPSDTMLDNMVVTDSVVSDQQNLFDSAEVERDLLQNYFNIVREGHIFFRGVSRARFE